jgi:hypothetical protein
MQKRTTSTVRLSHHERELAVKICKRYRLTGQGNAIRRALARYLELEDQLQSRNERITQLEGEIRELRSGLRRLDESLAWVAVAANRPAAPQPRETPDRNPFRPDEEE